MPKTRWENLSHCKINQWKTTTWKTSTLLRDIFFLYKLVSSIRKYRNFRRKLIVWTTIRRIVEKINLLNIFDEYILKLDFRYVKFLFWEVKVSDCNLKILCWELSIVKKLNNWIKNSTFLAWKKNTHRLCGVRSPKKIIRILCLCTFVIQLCQIFLVWLFLKYQCLYNWILEDQWSRIQEGLIFELV